jgi:long-chain acyl-CoA synthetase
MNAIQLVAQRFKQSKNDCFFTALDDKNFTYADFWNISGRLSDQWKSQGCKPGDVIVFLLPNSFSLLCCYLSCARGGFVACPIPPSHHPDLIRKLISLVSPTLVVKELPPPFLTPTPALDENFSIDFDQNRPFIILFTAGSTGEPKAICHSFQNIIGSARAFAELTGMSERTRLYHVFPMAYMAGILNSFFTPFMAGASIVEGPMFSPAAVLDFLDRPLRSGVNTLSLTPTIASALCRMSKKIPDLDKIPFKVVQVQCTSAPIPRALQEEFLEVFRIPLRNCYGITELGGPLTFQDEEDARHLRDWGIPVEGLEISLRGKDGQDLYIKSPFTMLGYLQDGRLTSPCDEAGFMDTGDLADTSDGKIRITGRKKDIIIRGGVNVSPKRVETVLEGMDEVEEVAVIGLPHPFWGEAITACVIPAAGHSDVSTKVAVFGRQNLSPHERPDHIILLQEFPRSFIGKIEKKKLQEMAILEMEKHKAGGEIH